jgi:hypothetical protein
MSSRGYSSSFRQKPNISLTQEGGAIGLQKCNRGDESNSVDEFEITFEEFKNTDEESFEEFKNTVEESFEEFKNTVEESFEEFKNTVEESEIIL